VGRSENNERSAFEVKNERMWRTSIQSALIAWSLTVIAAFSSTAQPNLHRPLVVIILGPPGSGKTTQATALAKKYRIPALSLSKLLQQQLDKGDKSKLLRMSVASGDLLDDAAANQLLEARLLQGDLGHGFILDGYPTTIGQAKLLDEFLKTDSLPHPTVVTLDAPDDVVRKRVLTRHRVDDNLEIINRRLSDYHAQSEFLIDWYGSAKLLHVDATQPIAQVFQQLDHLITEELVNKPPAFAAR
jgi:adenylate kinase